MLYIDAGAGSQITATLLSIFLGFFYMIKNKIYYFKSYKQNKSINNFTNEIVFFSEGKTYWRVFNPVIIELLTECKKVAYLTADKNDPGLLIQDVNYQAIYIGELREALYHLEKLKARICVMTTPQLGITTLRKSRNVDHYCHIIHSPTDIHAYKKFAFDNFDSVLCCNNFQIENIRHLEKIRGSQQKLLLSTGCTYYDNVIKCDSHEAGSILIAPTWGDRSFLKKHGIDLIDRVLLMKQKVILRPHPQSWISDKLVMEQLIEKFKNHSNFSIDKDQDSSHSLSMAKLLICDVTSGMAFDMALIYNKPVVGIKFSWEDWGYESSDLISNNYAEEFLNNIGSVIPYNDIININKHIVAALGKKNPNYEIKKYVHNYGAAGKNTANEIINISNN